MCQGAAFSHWGAENWRCGLGRAKKIQNLLISIPIQQIYILGLNRHMHSTPILWSYSGYIVFIHDNIVEYVTCQCRAEIYFRYLGRTSSDWITYKRTLRGSPCLVPLAIIKYSEVSTDYQYLKWNTRVALNTRARHKKFSTKFRRQKNWRHSYGGG